jgi:nicotinate phosphoribosyltransferase
MQTGNPIIQSLLDLDFYKLTMQNAALTLGLADADVKYRFKCRRFGLRFSDSELREIFENFYNLENLSFSLAELSYLESLGVFSHQYLERLVSFKLNADDINAFKNADGELEVSIEGTWFNTILFETLILSIISQVFDGKQDVSEKDRRKTITQRIKSLNELDVKYCEFGTRRRASREWQDHVFDLLSVSPNFLGTSNVRLSMESGMTPIGTMAHEYLQAFQGVCQNSGNLREFQIQALTQWLNVYRGKLSIALTDILGSDAFFRDFDLLLAKSYDGVRQDSGSPIDWYDKVIMHYSRLGLQGDTKKAIFSDGLDYDTILRIEHSVNGLNPTLCPSRIYAIGTNLTNNVGYDPLPIVIKMVSFLGHPVAKISDSDGKGMCEDEKYLAELKGAFNL